MTLKQTQPPLYYLSLPHECGYLAGKLATTLFVDPKFCVDQELYQQLLAIGFRRSGDLVYRPRCESCSACVPVRIPVAEFVSNRNQRRVWKKNAGITVGEVRAGYIQEHFELYQQYQQKRHSGSSMDNPDPQKYIDFVTSKSIATRFIEFRSNDKLLAVAIADQLPESHSAVYTFFDLNESWRSLGTYAILWQIEQCKRLGLRWLYLGYWIEQCNKMAYKTNYQPLEGYQNDKWSRLMPSTGP